MPIERWRGALVVAVIAAWVAGTGPAARADRVTLKNGAVYEGTRDRDNTIVSIFDEIRRIILHNAKIERIDSDAGTGSFERFRLVQPIEVHGGAMPEFA